jgi:hypothetical protein
VLRWLGFAPLLLVGCLDIGDTEAETPKKDASADAGTGGGADASSDAASGGNGGSGGGSGGSAGNAGSGGTGGSAGGSGSAGAGGSGPILIVNASTTTVSTVDVPTVTLTPSPSAGNSIIVGVSCMTSMDQDCVLTEANVFDNQGNDYALVIQGAAILSSQQGARPYLFIAQNIGFPNGPFVVSVDPAGTVPAQAQNVTFGAIEVSGLVSTPPSFDVLAQTPAFGSVSPTTILTPTATSQANELAVALLTIRSEDTNVLITPESTWTTHQVNQSGTNNQLAHSMISRVLTTTGTVTHTWTHDDPTRGGAAVLATFKGASP